MFHGKQAEVDLIVRVLACLAEGLGSCATARVFDVEANTVLPWLVEAAEQQRAFSAYFLCNLHLEQLQFDELYAVIRDLKAGEISEANALERLEPSRPWVWTAIDPVSKVLLAIEVGPRTGKMVQRVGHHIVSVLALGCVPAWFSDGFRGICRPLWATLAGGRNPKPPGQRPPSQTAMDAVAWAPLYASCQVVPAQTHGGSEAPRGVGDHGSRCAGPRGVWLKDQYRHGRAAQSRYPSACSRRRTARDYPLPGQGRRAASAGGVPGV
jgi:hypothetical protein